MRKRIVKVCSLFIVILLLLVLVPTPVCAQDTWYVNPTGGDDGAGDDTTGNGSEGSPWLTIQHAIDDSGVSGGDTIIVMDGTSSENVNVTKELTIQSQNEATNTFVEAASADDHVFEVTVNNVTITGFSVSGATGTGKAGIYLAGADDCIISSNRCGWDSDHKNYYGVFLYNLSDRNRVLGNTCSYNTGNGIRLQNICKYNMLSGNNICAYNVTGILLTGSNDLNVVSGNTCTSNTQGIWLANSNESNTISGNTCSGNSGRGIYLSGTSRYNTISKNTCSNNTTSGIYFSSSDSNIIYLNNFGNSTNVSSSNSTNTWKSRTEMCYFYSSSHRNYLGNYYSDHTLTDTDGDGITDDQYDLPGTEPNDAYPLAAAYGNYTVQGWWLHSDDNMYKGKMGKGVGSVEIAVSGTHIWIADEAAAADVTFPSGAWVGQLVFTSVPESGTILVEIGSSTNGTDFDPGGPETTTGDGELRALTFQTGASSVTIPSGQFLALRITNNDSATRKVVTGGAWSYTSSPDTGAPAYPVPELPTIVLMGIGLAALAGYFVLRRRRDIGRTNETLP